MWRSAATADVAAPSLSCPEITALVHLFRAAGTPDAADEWIAAHTASDPECQGHTEPFSVFDLADETATRLGDGWAAAEPGKWGIRGLVTGPCLTVFEFDIDYEDDLTIKFVSRKEDGFPDAPELPKGVRAYEDGVYFETACAGDGLENVAALAAAAIRAVAGRTPGTPDAAPPASLPDHCGTGRYLPKDHAEEA